MAKVALFFVVATMLFPTVLVAETAETTFWEWFKQNETNLFNFEKNQESIFDQLNKELKKVDKDLTFEFGQKEKDTREFVISASGIRNSFPAVEKLYLQAPKLDKFKITKFRQRRFPLNTLTFAQTTISPDSVRYRLSKDEDKIGITLFLRNYLKTEKQIYENIGYLFLDEALGEYDVEMKVGSIEFEDFNSKNLVGSRGLAELPKDFDQEYKKLNQRQ